ncbi:MAG: ABC transporter permease, partial [Mycoplasmataceae bacterium]|nr:ABC transporter permease [Mycoplasmataceae bacterium]
AMTVKSLILPIITVTLGSLAGYTILVRNQMVSILTSNHILIAKAKGLTQQEIFWKHIIRNISIPLIAYMVPSFIILLSGNIIIEQFFNVPGTSNVIMQAFPNGEINVVMFSIFFFASLSMVGQIILDISYIFIDPKIKYFEESRISISKNIINKFRRQIKYQKDEKQRKRREEINV